MTTPWPGAESALDYVLVQCGTPAPEGYDATQIIEVPVQSIATMSTSYLPFLDSLGLLNTLVAIDDATYVNNPVVLAMAERGEIAQIGYGAGVNIEQLLDLDPALIMTYGSGSPDYDAHPVLLNAGLHAVVNAEWLETSPLGRAEWGKFIALFFNREAQAEAQFGRDGPTLRRSCRPSDRRDGQAHGHDRQRIPGLVVYRRRQQFHRAIPGRCRGSLPLGR